MLDEVGDGAEVSSLIRDCVLDRDANVGASFDTGAEHQSGVEYDVRLATAEGR